MSVSLRTADGPALAAFLGRLLHFDRAAAVRLSAPAGGGVLAVFGRPPFDVLAVRPLRIADVPDGGVDATVSAGELLESLDETGESARFTVPADVAGASWAGMLPPRSGWRTAAEPGIDALRARVAEGVAAFRARVEALPEAERTRTVLDAAAAEIWDELLLADPGAGPGAGQAGGGGLPLRTAHAAHAMGFLPAPRGADAETRADAGAGAAERRAAVLRSGPWWRLRTGYGEIAYRRPVGAGLGLTVGAVTPS